MSKKFVGPSGKIPRGTHSGKGTGSKKVGVVRTPYKDTVLGR